MFWGQWIFWRQGITEGQKQIGGSAAPSALVVTCLTDVAQYLTIGIKGFLIVHQFLLPQPKSSSIFAPLLLPQPKNRSRAYGLQLSSVGTGGHGAAQRFQTMRP